MDMHEFGIIKNGLYTINENLEGICNALQKMINKNEIKDDIYWRSTEGKYGCVPGKEYEYVLVKLSNPLTDATEIYIAKWDSNMCNWHFKDYVDANVDNEKIIEWCPIPSSGQGKDCQKLYLGGKEILSVMKEDYAE